MKELSDKIFLLGMPGSGKSTLGAELSVILGYNFFDLDVEIEISEGYTVAEIFKKKGAAEFRKAEAKNLIDLTNRKKSFLMSTGGGTPCYFDNLEFMNAHGTTVFINADVNKIIQRVIDQQEKRPMFTKLSANELQEKMYELYEKRYAYYSKADIIIEEEDINIKTITYKLLDAQG